MDTFYERLTRSIKTMQNPNSSLGNIEVTAIFARSWKVSETWSK